MVERYELSRVVIDASAVLSQLLPDEAPPTEITDIFERFLHRQLILFAPTLLLYEVTNSLRSTVMSRRATETVAESILEKFLGLGLQYETPNFTKILQISLKHKISGYDAAYLALSQELKLPLISLDKKLTLLAQG